MPDARCQMSDVRFEIPDIRSQMSDAKIQISGRCLLYVYIALLQFQTIADMFVLVFKFESGPPYGPNFSLIKKNVKKNIIMSKMCYSYTSY